MIIEPNGKIIYAEQDIIDPAKIKKLIVDDPTIGRYYEKEWLMSYELGQKAAPIAIKIKACSIWSALVSIVYDRRKTQQTT